MLRSDSFLASESGEGCLFLSAICVLIFIRTTKLGGGEANKGDVANSTRVMPHQINFLEGEENSDGNQIFFFYSSLQNHFNFLNFIWRGSKATMHR